MNFEYIVYGYPKLNLYSLKPQIESGGITYMGEKIAVETIQDLEKLEESFLKEEFSLLVLVLFLKRIYMYNYNNPAFLSYGQNIRILIKFGIIPVDIQKTQLNIPDYEIMQNLSNLQVLIMDEAYKILKKFFSYIRFAVERESQDVITSSLLNSINDSGTRVDLINNAILFGNIGKFEDLNQMSFIFDFFNDSGDYTNSGITNIVNTKNVRFNQGTDLQKFKENILHILIFGNCKNL